MLAAITCLLFLRLACAAQQQQQRLWVLELSDAARREPRAVAARHAGLEYVGAALDATVSDAFHVYRATSPPTSARAERVRLDTALRADADAVLSFALQEERWRAKRIALGAPTPAAVQQRGERARDGDPLYAQQWHLHAPDVGIDAHLVAVAINGTGVTLAIVDDGLQWAHPELQANYDRTHSHNYNGGSAGQYDPTPQSPLGKRVARVCLPHANAPRADGHGTAAAAVAVAVEGNGHCGRGVAPLGEHALAHMFARARADARTRKLARVVGLRLIAAPVSDLTEATALSHFHGRVAVYSNSWGPTDDGQHMEAPGRLVREVFAQLAGASAGRSGLGTVFVWAAGNGRAHGDQCNFDGYANNPYVNAIGAVDSLGNQAWYSEGCAALLAVAPSSGGPQGPRAGITTADLLGAAGYDPSECTAAFGGTSSAAPLAAGVFSLLLQAQPNLTWRDVREVVARGATRIHASDSTADWHVNARGYHHSNAYGFGLLRVPPLLAVLAAGYKRVGPQVQIVNVQPTAGAGAWPLVIGDTAHPTQVDFAVEWNASSVNFVENAFVTVRLTHPHRGALRVTLTSPEQTVSVLAEPRAQDMANADYPREGWSFDSLRHWGETHVQGVWTLRIADTTASSAGRLQAARFGVFARHQQ